MGYAHVVVQQSQAAIIHVSLTEEHGPHHGHRHWAHGAHRPHVHHVIVHPFVPALHGGWRVAGESRPANLSVSLSLGQAHREIVGRCKLQRVLSSARLTRPLSLLHHPRCRIQCARLFPCAACGLHVQSSNAFPVSVRLTSCCYMATVSCRWHRSRTMASQKASANVSLTECRNARIVPLI